MHPNSIYLSLTVVSIFVLWGHYLGTWILWVDAFILEQGFFIVQHGLWETTLTEYTDPPDSAQNFTSCDESSLWRSTWQAFTVCKSATSKSPPNRRAVYVSSILGKETKL